MNENEYKYINYTTNIIVDYNSRHECEITNKYVHFILMDRLLCSIPVLLSEFFEYDETQDKQTLIRDLEQYDVSQISIDNEINKTIVKLIDKICKYFVNETPNLEDKLNCILKSRWKKIVCLFRNTDSPDNTHDIVHIGKIYNVDIHQKCNIKTALKNFDKYRRLKQCDTFIQNKDRCMICLEEYKIREYVRKMPCNHLFHKKCIDKWVCKYTQCCPTCRAILVKYINYPH